MDPQIRASRELISLRNFSDAEMSDVQAGALERMARGCRLDAVLMTGIAKSGHPAGALSSIDIYNLLMAAAAITPESSETPAHDKIVISHGHTSAGYYAALAAWGFIDRDSVVANFRRAGSPYQGHVERTVRGVDWGSGCLGQGLAAGVGFALADRASGRKNRVFVVMGDGEQPKGQLAEARRVAAKEKLSKITALIDANDIQISGRIEEVMPVNIRALWEADGWFVDECDGHDYKAMYAAIKRADAADAPTVIICRTVMGRGVSFMEGKPDYHGKPAAGDELIKAVEDLGGAASEIERLTALRAGDLPKERAAKDPIASLDLGAPKTYTDADKKDSRSAFGAALAEIASINRGVEGRSPILAFDCDLASSVKLDMIAHAVPEAFVQLGIQENAAATIAGAAAVGGAVSVWADFGVFALDEAYNQQRMNDINEAPIKAVLSHVGLDVGEDGMTHQCIDYVGGFRNMFGFKVVVPADPNQTDRATRWMLAENSSVALAFGRSVKPVICKDDGTPFFGGGYQFEYGRIDKIRDGSDIAILTMGHVASAALSARVELAARGISAMVLSCASPLSIDKDELLGTIGSRPLVIAEDHNVNTGLGATVALLVARAGAAVKMRMLGVSRYGESGRADDVIARMGISADGIEAAALAMA